MHNIEKRDATNIPTRSTAEKNNTNLKNIISIQILQTLRDNAWDNAMKYRYDPVLSRTHEQYLNQLNNLLIEHGE